MPLTLSRAICLLLIIFPSFCFGAELRRLPTPTPQNIDPTSLQLSVALQIMGAPGFTPVIKQGASVTLQCSWKAQFAKPVVLQTPINLELVIAEETSKNVHLHKSTAVIKAGNYTFPGPGGQGVIPVTWKPEGFGIHKVSCFVASPNPEWWGEGSAAIAKATRELQVEPDKFKFCPPMYPVMITKSPKGDQYGAAGDVKPVEIVLGLNTSQAAGNQFICHYRSQNNDVSDLTLTVPCAAAEFLPQQPGGFLKEHKYYCNE